MNSRDLHTKVLGMSYLLFLLFNRDISQLVAKK